MSELENKVVETAQDSVNSDIASVPSTASKPTVSLIAGIFIFLVLLVGSFAGYKYHDTVRGVDSGQSGQDAAKILLVLDTSLIMTAATKQILEDKSLSNDQVAEVSRKLAGNLKKVVLDYQAQGYIILNGTALVTWPKSADITTKTAEQLGIKLN